MNVSGHPYLVYRKQKFPLKIRIPINVLNPQKLQNVGVSK